MESDRLGPRQVRYQAARRPDLFIIAQRLEAQVAAVLSLPSHTRRAAESLALHIKDR
jgi:hypothetical protein